MAHLQDFWWYLVLIGVMIIVHEMGHYLAARLFDVKVETFSFGFGPRLFGFKYGETDFRFSLILFGGYVKMTGEQYSGDVNDTGTGQPVSADPRALTSKPRWQRMFIAFAGPAINVVLAVGLLAGLYMEHFEKIPNPASPVIGYLAADGAAAKAGLHVGDRIVQIEDIEAPTWEQVKYRNEAMSPNHPVSVWALRNGQRMHFTVTPVLEAKEGIGHAGWEQEYEIDVASVIKGKGMDAEKVGLQAGDILVSVNGEPLKSVSRLNEIESETSGAPLQMVYQRGTQEYTATLKPVWKDPDNQGKPRWMIGLSLKPRIDVVKLSFPAAISESVRQNTEYAQMIVQLLERMIQRRMPAKSLSGPIGMIQMSGEAAREGFLPFIGLMAAVSLNLAIFNLLPIPILDGGVMLMLFIEMLMRRDVDLRVKETVLKVGFVFLMFVLVFALYNDISKIFPPG